MLVALYKDESELPYTFGGTKGNPFDVFDSEKYKNIPLKPFRSTEVITLEKEKRLYSLLCGLGSIDTERYIAHVSALSDDKLKDEGYWCYSYTVVVQITTPSQEMNKEGVPVVCDNTGEVRFEIQDVFSYNPGGNTPYHWLSYRMQKQAEDDSAIWNRFFTELLGLDKSLADAIQAREVAKVALQKTEEEIKRLQLFGSDQFQYNFRNCFKHL